MCKFLFIISKRNNFSQFLSLIAANLAYGYPSAITTIDLSFATNSMQYHMPFFSYYETRKKSILVNIELYNVDEQIKNHFY